MLDDYNLILRNVIYLFIYLFSKKFDAQRLTYLLIDVSAINLLKRKKTEQLWCRYESRREEKDELYIQIIISK